MDKFKIVTVRIKDNTEKINELKALETEASKAKEETTKTIDDLQRKSLIQMLAYIKCAYEDWFEIMGDAPLYVCNLSRSVCVSARKSGINIQHNFAWSVEADYENGNIRVLNSTRQGIDALMKAWGKIKFELQEKIDKAYRNKCKTIESELSELASMVYVAKNFEI